jgi:3-oxo-4,17-pregnadiene-20-carboxyl-CoA hydratase alpha subunit
VSAPHPRPDPVTDDDAAFWEHIARGELHLQRCASCATFRHPPRPVCAHCGSTAREWVRAGGGGEVWTYTVVHPPTLPAFADRVPYGAVVVRLDEGVFMVSNLVDCPVDELAVGGRVEVAITEVDDGVVLPLFRRA